ncbi:MAG: DMT family transporter [Actinomycetota bacterium]
MPVPGVLARSSNRTLGTLAVAVATCVWATGSVIVKWSSITGLHFAMFRLWSGAVISCLALLITRRRLPWATFRACALGGVLFATDIALHFSAVKRTSIANVAVIGSLAPVVIAIASARLLHEKVPRHDAVLAGVAFVGVLAVAIGTSNDAGASLGGDVLAVINIVSWSSYWFFSRRARAQTGPIEYFACVMLAGAAFITPVALIFGGVPAVPSARDVFAVVTVAALPGFVGHSLVIWSHAHVESWRSALITQATPVIATLLAFAFLHEPISPIVAVGGGVVIACTAAVIVHAARREASVADVAVESPG